MKKLKSHYFQGYKYIILKLTNKKIVSCLEVVLEASMQGKSDKSLFVPNVNTKLYKLTRDLMRWNILYNN